MDPFSLVGGGIAIASVCLQVARVLHTTIETYKGCSKELTELLTRTEGLLLQLRRLEVANAGLSDSRRQYLANACGESRCMETVVELNNLVWNVQNAGIGTRGKAGFSKEHEQDSADGMPVSNTDPNQTSFMTKLKWFLVKHDAAKLVLKLKEHQQDIFMAVTTIALCVRISLHTNTPSLIVHIFREATISAEANTNILIQDNAAVKANIEKLAEHLVKSTEAVLAFQRVPSSVSQQTVATSFKIPQAPTHPQQLIQNEQVWYGTTYTNTLKVSR
jgi:hypothetical protein